MARKTRTCTEHKQEDLQGNRTQVQGEGGKHVQAIQEKKGRREKENESLEQV